MTAFHIYRSNRVEQLVDALGGLLAAPQGGPLRPESIVVQGRGMAVWLGMELARRLGVWASRIEFPREFVQKVTAAVLPDAAVGRVPISEELLTWAVHASLPGLLATPEFAVLRRYVEPDPQGIRIAQLSARIASVFDKYLLYRPDWIRAWESGLLTGSDAENTWQPRLFREVHTHLGRRHLAALEPELLRCLGSTGVVPSGSLPPRVSVFGIATLPPLYVRILAALSDHVEVHVFSFATSSATQREQDGSSSDAPLSGYDFVARDFERLLRDVLAEKDAAPIEHLLFARSPVCSVLAALQNELHEPGAGAAGSAFTAPHDDSVTAHACHGPMREVEVLHDQLLQLLTRKQDRVAPEDVVVLVPDLATYAPFVDAVFARDPGSPDFVPYHVSDRSSRRESPIIDAFSRLLAMVRGRVTAAEVIDLLMLEAVSARFELDPTSVDTLKDWIVAGGIRWGMDPEHRASLGLPASGEHTFQHGLARLLLGYAMPTGGRRLFHGILPYDEVEGQSAALLGKLSRFVRVLFGALRELERARPLCDWVACVAALTADLFADDADSIAQVMRLRRAMEALAETAALAGFSDDVDVAVVQQLLEQQVDALDPERGFLAGGVTFSAAVPMRSIPFRVVCLLGLNDAVFPRSGRPIEFDLLRHGPEPRRPGDRSSRDDDRYLFLETLCAAREKLIVTFTGKSVRDNRERPPSVCVSDLLEWLRRRGNVPAHALTVEHRLQGFSPAYFDGSEAPLFSYARGYARAARSLCAEQRTRAAFINEPQPFEAPKDLPLDDLLRFFRSPPAYYLNRRLRIQLRNEQVRVSDREPLELDELSRWRLGDRLVGHLLDGVSLADSEALLRGAGELPAGSWGKLTLLDLAELCSKIAAAVRTLRDGPALPVLDVQLPLGPELRVIGSVDALWPGGRVEFGYSVVRPKHLLAAWIRHIAGCAAAPAPFKSFLVGRSEDGADVRELLPVPSEEARALVAQLAELYHQGQQSPLRFLPAPSLVYAKALLAPEGKRAGATPLAKAITAYEQEFVKTESDPHAELAFDGLLPPFDSACELAQKALEDTEFHRLARSVFEPFLRWSGE